MNEREEIRVQIAALEEEKLRLQLEEQILDATFWLNPDTLAAKECEERLDDILDRFDRISDILGALKSRLYLLDAAVSRREHIADVSYGHSL